jgi:hypothetical protein
MAERGPDANQGQDVLHVCHQRIVQGPRPTGQVVIGSPPALLAWYARAAAKRNRGEVQTAIVRDQRATAGEGIRWCTVHHVRPW